jgi:acyl carrier protein
LPADTEDDVTTSEVLHHIGETLSIDPARLRADSKATDFEEWDSMGVMNLLLMLDSDCGVKLLPGETDKLRSVDGILGLLKKAGKLS